MMNLELQNFMHVEDSQNHIVLEASEDVFDVFVEYVYRKKVVVSQQLLQKTLLFASHLQNTEFYQFLLKHLNSQNTNTKTPSETMDQIQEIELNFTTIPKDLAQFANNKLYSDVSFEFPNENSPEKLVVYGHKVILAANCPYLSKMFSSGLQESKQSAIQITHVPYEIFLQVVHHCYGGKVQFSSENCVDLLQVADLFGLDYLKLMCELFIGKQVDNDNCKEVIHVSQMYNAPRLANLCEHSIDNITKANSEPKWASIVYPNIETEIKV